MIDVHAHLLPRDLPDFATKYAAPGWPVLTTEGSAGAIHIDGELYRTVDERYWSASRRLEYLDEYGIDRQVVSPLPVCLPGNGQTRGAAEMARWLNSAVAHFVHDQPQRLYGFGTVAFDSPGTVASGLDDILANGLRGIEFPSLFAGAELGTNLCRDLLVECAERGLPVLVHPTDGGVIPRLVDGALKAALGVTTDTAVAAFTLLLSDVFEQAPGLRLCLSHGGGTLFWVLPRLCRILGADRGERIRLAAEKFWVDSASLDPEQIRYLLNFVAPDRLLLGSDFPAAISDPRSPFVGTQPRLADSADPALAFLQGEPS